MRLHGMQVHARRRTVVTTDSHHDGPIFPNLAKDMAPDGPDQLWVASAEEPVIANAAAWGGSWHSPHPTSSPPAVAWADDTHWRQ
jgi:hypothetical protein